MKMGLLIFCSFLFCLECFAQTRNRLSISFASANNGLEIPKGWYGDMGHSGKGADLYELRYSREINTFISLETGLQYSVNKIETNYFPDGIMHYLDTNIKMLSIPLYGDLTFWKYFFIYAGPMIDFEVHHKSSTTFNQSGLGFGFGVGGRYRLKNFTISLNPFYQRHLIVPYKKEVYHENLWESGIKIGLGYNF